MYGKVVLRAWSTTKMREVGWCYLKTESHRLTVSLSTLMMARQHSHSTRSRQHHNRLRQRHEVCRRPRLKIRWRCPRLCSTPTLWRPQTHSVLKHTPNSLSSICRTILNFFSDDKHLMTAQCVGHYNRIHIELITNVTGIVSQAFVLATRNTAN